MLSPFFFLWLSIPPPPLGPMPSSFLVVVCLVDLIYTEFAVPSPISPEPLPAVLLYADDIAEFCPLAFPPAPSLGPVPSSFLVVVCVVDLIYTE